MARRKPEMIVDGIPTVGPKGNAPSASDIPEVKLNPAQMYYRLEGTDQLFTEAELEALFINHKITSNQLRKNLGFPDYVPREEFTDGEKHLNKRAEILQTAEKLINGDRADTYGPPEVSFGRIADLLNAMGWVKKRFGEEEEDPEGQPIYEPLKAVDVALGLIQLKISRIISSPDHEDSWVERWLANALQGVKDE